MDAIMRLNIFLFVFLCLGVSNQVLALNSLNGRGHLVNGCKIFDIRGVLVKVLPGDFCVFFDNGDFVSVTRKDLKFYQANGEIKWSDTNQFYHHQLNISPDKKRLLVMGSDEKMIDGRKYRIDQMMVYDVDTGKILLKKDSDEIIKLAKINPYVMKDSFPAQYFSTTEEYSHFNSFYEIADIKTTTRHHPAIKKGNFIINSVSLGFFILDSMFEKVLFYERLEMAVYHAVHDVQVTARGSILAFINKNITDPLIPSSSVVEFDLLTKKRFLEMKADPPSLFYSRICGGVQDLGNGIVFFSHNFAGAFAYDSKTKKIIYSNHYVFMDGDRIIPTQQIKAERLDSFLKNNGKNIF